MSISLILRLLLPEILAILQSTIKNPQSLATELPILQAVYTALGTVIAGINPPTT